MNEPDTASEEHALSLCAREPIHHPGAIQPHGALLAALPDSGLVTHASANLAAFLGFPPDAVLGRPLVEVVGAVVGQGLLEAEAGGGTSRSETHAIAGHPGAIIDLQSHRSGRHICVDIEPRRPEPWQRPTITMARSVLETFNDATSQVELCERAVRGLREITFYDRVMAYRFGADGHGEVIAEDRAAGLAPYLGQRYPASDIPPC